MVAISPLATVAVLVPLVVVRVAAALVRRPLQETQRASRRATGQVTGSIGEAFGAVLAIKVNTAETDVVGHLSGLGEVRRRAELRHTLLHQLVQRSWSLTDTLATGLVLLVVAPSLQEGSFTVGDFALFVSFIGVVGGALSWIGGTLVDATQARVSLERLVELLQGEEPPEVLVEHGPVYMRGRYPPVPYVAKTPAHRLDRLEVRGLGYRDPESRPRSRRDRPEHPARLVHCYHRAGRLREEHTVAVLPRATPSRRGGDPLERRGGGRYVYLPGASPGGLHAAGAAALQRDA